MGSITKKPTAPTTIVRTIPASKPVISTASITQTVTPLEPVKTDSEIARESRTQSLLSRSRGRLGTVLTGFRGFLSQTADGFETKRKTLLGE